MPACPACGKGGGLSVKCDTCNCCFCSNGNCTGTFGGKLKLSGSGRSVGTKCKACGKGKMVKL
tara:strand:- start:3555 stop:3743 length:189 start_codon:yes stop_codon:yes gene_type:complete